jgi:hypothetical protein
MYQLFFNELGYILGDFFRKSSGHPGCRRLKPILESFF